MLGWFKKKKEPEDYEGVLAALELDIQRRRTRLSEIRLRERRTSLVLTLYACGIWVAYVATWYTGILQRHITTSRSGQVIIGTSVFLGPIIIQLARRIVQVWFSRIEDAEEKSLKELLLQQRSKLTELKEKTNFNTIRDLLYRYNDPTAASQQSFAANGSATSQPNQMMQRRGVSPLQTLAQTNGTVTSAPTVEGPSMPMMPPRKHWYDKLADVLLGEVDVAASGPMNRYALICQKCFTHNGLVLPSLYEVTQHVCPRCGHFNPAPRSVSSVMGLSASMSSEGMSNSPVDVSTSSTVSPDRPPLSPAALAMDPNTLHFQDSLAAARSGTAVRSRKSKPATSTAGKDWAGEDVALNTGGDTDTATRKSMQAGGSPHWSTGVEASSSADGESRIGKADKKDLSRVAMRVDTGSDERI